MYISKNILVIPFFLLLPTGSFSDCKQATYCTFEFMFGPYIIMGNYYTHLTITKTTVCPFSYGHLMLFGHRPFL